MTTLQLVILGIVQGITEFLPISSSAHLILVPKFMHAADQGLLVDVGAHAGTLLAVLIFFWRDVKMLLGGVWDAVNRRQTFAAKMVFFLIIGSLPGGILGLILEPYQVHLREAWIIATTTIVWGAALWWADARFAQEKNIERDLNWKTVMLIGCAQALALIPGTSRSGITMTAARASGFSRVEAARFSFLLSMPLTAAAVLLMLVKIAKGEASGEAVDAFFIVAAISFVTAIFTIWFLMKFLRRYSFKTFVIYRFILAAVLLIWFV